MKRIAALLSVLCVASLSRSQGPMRVAAAADLEPVLPPILEQFKQATGIDALATYQASATLATQIQNGAPFDVFLSADLGYPQRLIAAGLAEGLGEGTSGTPITYAEGTLVLWDRKDSRLPPPSLDLLHNPDLKRLAIANPQRAPYGKAAVSALQKLGFYDALNPRLVIAENIAQAAQYAQSGNADAGLISLTSAMTSELQSSGRYFVIPRDLYPPIEQGAVLITKSSQRVAAKEFLVFLMSAPAQEQLRKYGLMPGRPVPDGM